MVSSAGADAESCATATARERSVRSRLLRRWRATTTSTTEPSTTTASNVARAAARIDRTRRLIARARTRHRAPFRSRAARRACGGDSTRSGRPRSPCAAPCHSSATACSRVTTRRECRRSSARRSASRALSGDRPPRAVRRPRARFEGHVAEGEQLLGLLAAPQERAHAGEQLVRREGLHEVVVRTGVEAGDAIGEPRRARSGAAPASRALSPAAGGTPRGRRDRAGRRRARRGRASSVRQPRAPRRRRPPSRPRTPRPRTCGRACARSARRRRRPGSRHLPLGSGYAVTALGQALSRAHAASRPR